MVSLRSTVPALVLCSTALVPAAVAQRAQAQIEWQKRQAVIDYGVVKVGKHTLDELPAGQNWRMGNNEASTLKTQVPLFVGDEQVAPGAYRVAVLRRDAKAFELQIAGGGGAFGGGPRDVVLKSEFATAPKPNDKLVLDWQLAAKKSETGLERDSTLKIQFGPNVMTVNVGVPGGKASKTGEWAVDVFALPAELLAGRLDKNRPTVIATVRGTGSSKKTQRGFNVVLAKDTVTLVPWMEAPTDSFGFGEVKAPAAGEIQTGKAETATASGAHPLLDATKVERLPGGEILLQVAFGDRALSLTVPNPSKAGEKK